MAEDFFNIAQHTDDDIVAGFRWTGRGVIHDGAGVSLALACIYRGRGMAARWLIAASGGKHAWVERLIRAGADPERHAKDGKGVADLAPAS